MSEFHYEGKTLRNASLSLEGVKLGLYVWQEMKLQRAEANLHLYIFSVGIMFIKNIVIA